MNNARIAGVGGGFLITTKDVHIPDDREHHFRTHRERDSGMIVNTIPG